MATKPVSKSWNWQLAVSRTQLWPLLSDTERLNEALGLPCYRLRETIDTEGVRRRYGEYDINDERIRWEELPMEWAAPHWWRWEREHEAGPFERSSATLVLEPTANGGTDATYTLEVLPRGISGRMLAASGHLATAARGFEQVVRMAEAHCRQPLGDFFSNLAATRNPKSKKGRKEQVPRDRFSNLREWATIAPATDLLALRPRILARALGLRNAEALKLCHEALEAGLLALRYLVTCPMCQREAREEETPAGFPKVFGCRHCSTQITRDFGGNVELLFRAMPSLRAVPDAVHCASAPWRTPLSVLQQNLEPRERRELETRLTPDVFRARVVDGAAGEQQRIDMASGLLVQAGDNWVQAVAQPDQIVVENHGDKRHTLVVERVGVPANVTLVAEALTVQCWFQRYSTRTLGLTRDDRAGEAAVLVVIDETDAHRRVVEKAVARCEGALVAGDDVVSLLLFALPEQARAAVDDILATLPEASVGGAFGPILLDASESLPLVHGPAVETARINAQSGRKGQFIASDSLAAAPLDLV